jgi:hypothetical protein
LSGGAYAARKRRRHPNIPPCAPATAPKIVTIPGREQDAMDPRQADKESRGIRRRHRYDTSMRDRLDHEDDQHEERPEQDHRVHPPERRAGEQAPEIEPPRHPEPSRAGQGNRESNLRREASFDRLEQRPAFPRVGVRPRERQRNERHESDAANPVDDEPDMQRTGDFDIVDHEC